MNQAVEINRRTAHMAIASGLTVMLLGFLAMTRMFHTLPTPDLEIREVQMLNVALPPPPPPPDLLEEPPPPPPRPLPKLELQLEQVAPAIKATLDRDIDLTMEMAEFDLEVDPPPQPVQKVVRSKPSPKPAPRPAPPAPKPAMKSTYSVGELDGRPRLLNSPSASFPSSLSRQGVREGRVMLEVQISTSGRASVRRILSSSHPELNNMATEICHRARFSTPKKNGQPVNAIFQWPLVLRP